MREATVNEPVAKRRSVKADLEKVRAYIGACGKKTRRGFLPSANLLKRLGSHAADCAGR